MVAKSFKTPINPMTDQPLLSKQLNVWDALTTINHLKTFESVYHNDIEEDSIG